MPSKPARPGQTLIFAERKRPKIRAPACGSRRPSRRRLRLSLTKGPARKPRRHGESLLAVGAVRLAMLGDGRASSRSRFRCVAVSSWKTKRGRTPSQHPLDEEHVQARLQANVRAMRRAQTGAGIQPPWRGRLRTAGARVCTPDRAVKRDRTGKRSLSCTASLGRSQRPGRVFRPIRAIFSARSCKKRPSSIPIRQREAKAVLPQGPRELSMPAEFSRSL